MVRFNFFQPKSQMKVFIESFHLFGGLFAKKESKLRYWTAKD